VAYVRRLKLEALRGLAGGVDIDANEEIEAADVAEARRTLPARSTMRGDGGKRG
jgi:hypothetical protein